MINRNRIINAAILVFAKKGRYGAHVQEIAYNAHINKATIYYFYHSKDELYFEVIKHVFENLIDSLILLANSLPENQGSYPGISSNDIFSHVSFFADKQNYMKILVDSLSNGSVEVIEAIKYINETYKEKNIVNLMKNLLERAGVCKNFQNINTDQFMTNIFVMLVIIYLPGYMQELWSEN